MLVTTGFLKEGGVEPVLFGHAEVVMLGPADVVIVSLGPAEVVMIVKTLDIILAESSQSLRRDNKDDNIDEPHHSRLMT